MWLRLACLTVSFGLHAGLGALGWQSLAALSVDDGPITVALVERTATASLPASSSAPVGSRSKVTSSPSPRRTSTPPPVVPARDRPVPSPSAESLCEVPEAAVVDAPAETMSAALPADYALPAGEGTGADVSLVGGGTGSGSGPATRGPDRKGGGDWVGGLIRATPRYESNPLPDYPRLARQNRWEGTVRLRARVTARGNVEGVSLERSSGHAVLDRSALDGVQRWRFIPATRGGVPIDCEVSIPVAFRLTE